MARADLRPERLAPVEEVMIRSVLAGGGAKADAFVRAGEPLRDSRGTRLILVAP
jgi:hypothetical protein